MGLGSSSDERMGREDTSMLEDALLLVEYVGAVVLVRGVSPGDAPAIISEAGCRFGFEEEDGGTGMTELVVLLGKVYEVSSCSLGRGLEIRENL